MRQVVSSYGHAAGSRAEITMPRRIAVVTVRVMVRARLSVRVSVRVRVRVRVLGLGSKLGSGSGTVISTGGDSIFPTTTDLRQG